MVVNLYGQAEWFVVVTLLWSIWTELSVGVSHEVRLEDVSTAAILPEQPIIQIHFQTSCLKIQSHFGREEESKFIFRFILDTHAGSSLKEILNVFISCKLHATIHVFFP